MCGMIFKTFTKDKTHEKPTADWAVSLSHRLPAHTIQSKRL